MTPVTDIRVHRGDLVLSTQGRSFWVLDDITPLRQLTDEVKKADHWLFAPRTAYRGGASEGASLYYSLEKLPEKEVKLEILDGSGNVVRSFEGKAGDEPAKGPRNRFAAFFGAGPDLKLPVKKGLNRFIWNLREKGPEIPKGVVHWGGAPGMEVVPGSYQVRVSAGDWSQTQPLQIALTPTLTSTVADLQKQHDLGVEIATEIRSLFDTLTSLRDVKSQTSAILERVKKAGIDNKEVTKSGKAMTDKLTELEEKITQVKSKSGQDPINFPPMIDNQLTGLYSYVVLGDFQPTAGAYQRFDDLKPELRELEASFENIEATDVAAFNRLVSGLSLPPVVVPKKGAATSEGGSR